MKDFFHFGPPFAGFSGRKRILHGFHDGPPFLRFRIGGHLGPIRLTIGAVILHVAEEQVVFQINGVVPDVAGGDGFQDVRPDGGVIFFVTFDRFPA